MKLFFSLSIRVQFYICLTLNVLSHFCTVHVCVCVLMDLIVLQKLCTLQNAPRFQNPSALHLRFLSHLEYFFISTPSLSLSLCFLFFHSAQSVFKPKVYKCTQIFILKNNSIQISHQIHQKFNETHQIQHIHQNALRK